MRSEVNSTNENKLWRNQKKKEKRGNLSFFLEG
jgi:hypothetical protein